MWEEELVFISLVRGVHHAWLMGEQNVEGGLPPDSALLSTVSSGKAEVSGHVGEGSWL